MEYLIPPPSKTDMSTRSIQVVVDSRDRDKKIYPQAYSYAIEFDNPFCDVVSVELSSANIPLSRRNVDSSNCAFFFNGGLVTFPLSRQYYSVSEILSFLVSQTALTVTFDSNRFTFSSLAPFTLSFQLPNSACFLLGFADNSVNSSLANSLTSTSDASLLGFTPYAVLSIGGFKNLTSVSNVVRETFAIIDEDCKYKEKIATKYFNPPLADLRRLRIKITDSEGNPYPFSQKDHYFQLKMSCLKNGRSLG